MSNTRQPLLTEEQIQEMLEYARKYPDTVTFLDVWLVKNNRPVRDIVDDAGFNPTEVGMDKFLAFLRGKTKRVLNLDRLRKDVKAWVDDPNRKYPEWMAQLNPKIIIGFGGVPYLKTDEMSEFMSINYHSFYPYSFASMVGINPDDYFEEQIIE